MSVIEIRKIQKSATGFYFTFPKKIADSFKLKGGETLKITCNEMNKVTVEVLKL